ncbi:MAG TPA: OmpA family protein [Prolixibacteraceae bacterium]|nr:OmpA family protein [Prolixibacteraceae bacterium]
MARTIKIYLLTFVLIALCGTVSFGQKITTKLADKRFNEFAYVAAIKLYEYAYQKDSSDHYILKQLAEANRRIGNNPQVEQWLKKIIDRHKAKPEDIYHYFQALKSNGKYESAQYWLDKYSALISAESGINPSDSFLNHIGLLMSDSMNYDVKNVSLNTVGSELGPVYYNNQVIFSSTSIENKSEIRYKWNELPFLHMYAAEIDPATGDLLMPKPFAPKLRTAYHDGPASFDQSNELIYFTRNNLVKGKTAKSKQGVVNLKIFHGAFSNGEWIHVGEFNYNSDEYSVGHPSINKDGTILYFASDMPGGYGKSDLYYSVRSNDEWGAPVNLGPAINTSGNEFFPFVSKDGAIYFASDRFEGLGGMDIYFTIPENGIFGKSQNMGYPVNTSNDDFALTLDSTGMKGYFCSNRPGGKGDDDIYYLKIKSDSLIIKGIVKEKGSNDLIAGANVFLMDLQKQIIRKSITDVNGAFEFKLRSKEKYLLNVGKESYLENIVQPTNVSHNMGNILNQEIFIEKVVEKQTDVPLSAITMEEGEGPVQMIDFRHINYDLDQSFIRKDAAAILDQLIVYLKESPDIKIKIESHTDARAKDDYNLRLSKKRALAAFDYIVSKGIDPDRVSYFGFGETRLLNNCGNGVICDDKKHEENRRSIVKVFRKVNDREKL